MNKNDQKIFDKCVKYFNKKNIVEHTAARLIYNMTTNISYHPIIQIKKYKHEHIDMICILIDDMKYNRFYIRLNFISYNKIEVTTDYYNFKKQSGILYNIKKNIKCSDNIYNYLQYRYLEFCIMELDLYNN